MASQSNYRRTRSFTLMPSSAAARSAEAYAGYRRSRRGARLWVPSQSDSSPLLLDGRYDHFCTLEIADMDLTIQLADELGVGLRIGRSGENRYGQRKLDRYDKRLGVVEPAQVAFGVRLQVPDYRAPSKYGADPAHPSDQEFLTDAVGRIPDMSVRSTTSRMPTSGYA